MTLTTKQHRSKNNCLTFGVEVGVTQRSQLRWAACAAPSSPSASSKSSAPAAPSTSFAPRLLGVVEILEAHFLFSCCCSRPTMSSGTPSDIADTRAQPAPSAPAEPLTPSTPCLSESSASSAPSMSATKPRQTAPQPRHRSRCSFNTTCLFIGATAPVPRPTPPCPDNPGAVVTALPTPLAFAPRGATCPASSAKSNVRCTPMRRVRPCSLLFTGQRWFKLPHSTRLCAIAHCAVWDVAARSLSPLCMLPFHWVLFWATRGPLEAESSTRTRRKSSQIHMVRCQHNIWNM